MLAPVVNLDFLSRMSPSYCRYEELSKSSLGSFHSVQNFSLLCSQNSAWWKVGFRAVNGINSAWLCIFQRKVIAKVDHPTFSHWMVIQCSNVCMVSCVCCITFQSLFLKYSQLYVTARWLIFTGNIRSKLQNLLSCHVILIMCWN